MHDQVAVPSSTAQRKDILIQISMCLPAAYTKYYYIDETFHGIDWDEAFHQALEKTYRAKDSTAVDMETAKFLDRLGDPFTRMIDFQQAEVYKAESQGGVRSLTLLSVLSPAFQGYHKMMRPCIFCPFHRK
jgi:hypothetical protein